MRCTSPLRLACEITGANSQLNRNPQSPREPTWVPGEKRIQFWRPLHHSFFQSVNSLSLGAWYCLRLGIPEKWVHFSEPKVPLICTTKKEMVTHSNNLFWEISWTEEPGGLLYGVTKSWRRLSNSATTRNKECRFLIIWICYLTLNKIIIFTLRSRCQVSCGHWILIFYSTFALTV